MNIEKLTEISEQYALQNNLVVVKLKCSPSNIIEIYLDSIEGVALDKCIELNRLIDEQFDREVEDYELTVSSASISEPFSHPIQFEKNIGRAVELHTKDSTKHAGVLESADENGFTISYVMKVAEEGKKRKVEKEFTETFAHADVREIKLSFK